jgi:hypothetical protein
MAFCYRCGQTLSDGAKFCENCGTSVTPVPQSSPVSVPTTPAPTESDYINEEQEFLDNTRKLLRWERNALKICGIVMLALGATFTGLFSLLGALFFLVAIAEGSSLIAISFVYFLYAFIFGIYIAVGIIELCAMKKIPYYLDTMYTDIRPTATRCGSVGMLIFNIFFGNVAFVFFLINFIRIKSNQETIARIIARQQ